MKLYAGKDEVLFKIEGELYLFRDIEDAIIAGKNVYEFSVPEKMIFDATSRAKVVFYLKRLVKVSGVFNCFITPEMIEAIINGKVEFKDLTKLFEIKEDDLLKIEKAHLEIFPPVVNFNKSYYSLKAENLKLISVDIK